MGCLTASKLEDEDDGWRRTELQGGVPVVMETGRNIGEEATSIAMSDSLEIWAGLQPQVGSNRDVT